MIIHLPTGKKFHNRKEAKIYFSTAYYYKMAQRRESLNMGEFAEEAVTVEEVAAALNLFHAYNPSKDLHLLRTLGQMSISTSEDSTPLRVCRNQRILIHKTFEGLAERGKYSMGWSFGFKLHLIINDKGEILNFMFTPGCDRFCKWADRFFGAVVTVGIGKVCNEVSNLRFSYEGAWEALSYRVIYGSGCSINIADIAPKGQGLSMQPDDINMNDVFKAVHIGVREDIEHAVFSLVKELKDNAKTIMQYNFTVLEIVGHLYRFCGNNHMKFEDHAGEIKNAYEEITKMDESALLAWLVRVALSISDELKNARNSSLRYLISEAKNIVRDEYADADLSLDTVCSKLGVSNSYFSSIFKKEVGISFITYLTDYRMQQAVHLMLETNEKNYEIAEHVGYEDANYFGYVFKRKYGMSPSKYRTEHMGK